MRNRSLSSRDTRILASAYAVFLVVLLSIMVGMIDSLDAKASPKISSGALFSAGGACTSEWASFTVEDGTVATTTSTTGFLVGQVINLDEIDVVVDGTVAGQACFEWGNDTAKFKLRHLCASAEWTVEWYFNGNLTGTSPLLISLSIAVGDIDAIDANDSIPKTSVIHNFAGVGGNNRQTTTMTAGGVTLDEDSRIAIFYANLTAGTTTFETRNVTKIIFTSDECFGV